MKIEAKKYDNPIAVIFHTNWCSYCRVFFPIFKEYFKGIGMEYDEIRIDNYDDSVWNFFQIEAVPTVIIFRKGKQIARRDSFQGNGLVRKDMISLTEEVNSKTRK